jgi:hypothetical protein
VSRHEARQELHPLRGKKRCCTPGRVRLTRWSPSRGEPRHSPRDILASSRSPAPARLTAPAPPPPTPHTLTRHRRTTVSRNPRHFLRCGDRTSAGIFTRAVEVESEFEAHFDVAALASTEYLTPSPPSPQHARTHRHGVPPPPPSPRTYAVVVRLPWSFGMSLSGTRYRLLDDLIDRWRRRRQRQRRGGGEEVPDACGCTAPCGLFALSFGFIADARGLGHFVVAWPAWLACQ